MNAQHPFVESHQAALAQAHSIGCDIETLIKAQFEVEKRAYIEVFGEYAAKTRHDGWVYCRKADWFKINEDSELEAWFRGSYGGEDYSGWSRALDPESSDEHAIGNLYDKYLQMFKDRKAAEEKVIADAIARRRETLLAELAKLDNKG